MWDLSEHFVDYITDDIERYVTDEVMQESRYIFITKEERMLQDCVGGHKKEKVYKAYCTHCKKEYEIDPGEIKYYRQNSRCYCEECATAARTKFTRYSRSKLIDTGCFVTFQKSPIDEKIVVARGYYVERDYTGDYRKVVTKYTETSRILLTDNESIRISRNWYSKEWYPNKNYVSYKNGFNNYYWYFDEKSLEKAIVNTKLQYSQYNHYTNRWYYDPVKYLFRFCEYPIIEKLEKMGFYQLSETIAMGCSCERQVNFKRQDDVFKFLKLNRAEVKELREEGIDPGPKFLKMYRLCKKDKLSINETRRFYETGINIDYYAIIFKYQSIKKAWNYLNKRTRGSNYEWNMYKDYLENCEKLNLNLKEELILHPKDLKARHDALIKKVRVEKDKKLDKKIKNRLPALKKKYTYKNNKYLIRPAESANDVFIEGTTLSHCVYTNYLKPYAEGETDILFVRKIGEEDKPYFTMEVKYNSVMQFYGKGDCRPNKEMNKFKKEFEEKVLKKYKKNKKKVA